LRWHGPWFRVRLCAAEEPAFHFLSVRSFFGGLSCFALDSKSLLKKSVAAKQLSPVPPKEIRIAETAFRVTWSDGQCAFQE